MQHTVGHVLVWAKGSAFLACSESYPFKLCSLKHQGLSVGGTLEVYSSGKTVPWTSGYIL
jgi:hypothetical protein